MALEASSRPVFAGHQTFHPRFGWIKKGLDACRRDPGAFHRPDAPVQLGVGKNMVEAIRFWTLATRMAVRAPNPERPRLADAHPTRIGLALLGEGGLDPYLEDPSTMWVLHWLALSAPSMLPVWRATFNDFTALEFDETALLRFVEDEIAATTWSPPHPSSVRKDVDCLLRMYSSTPRRGRQTIDDLLDSPFRDLELVVPAAGEDGSYRFVRGPKPTLTPLAVAYACLDFLACQDGTARTATTTRLTLDDGSPGRLLKIGERELTEALAAVGRPHSGLALATPAGTTQLVLDDDPAVVARALLVDHHGRRGQDLTGLPAGPLAGPQARLRFDSVTLLDTAGPQDRTEVPA
jgi:hypothetical protein